MFRLAGNRRRYRRIGQLALGLLAVAVVAPASASAGEARLIDVGVLGPHELLDYDDTTDTSAATLTVSSRVDTRETGQPEKGGVTERRLVYTLTDPGGISAGSGCVQETHQSVNCPMDFGSTARPAQEFNAELGASGDSATVSPSFAVVTLSGGAGNDTLNGGPSPTTTDGGIGDDTLQGGPAGDRLSGSDGSDSVIGGGGADVLDEGAGDGSVSGGGGDDSILGAGGADTLNDGAGSDSVSGGDGNDILQVGTGADDLRGDAGLDTASYAARTAAVGLTLNGIADDGNADDANSDNVGPDIEHATGGSGADLIDGNAANNTLSGGGGADQLQGHGGGDTLNGGTGADGIQGGAGVDTVTYGGRKAAVTVTLLDDGANDGGETDGPVGARDAIGADVENVNGGAGGDSLTGNSLANAVKGAGGNDTIDVAGDTARDVVNCGPGTDSVSRDVGDIVKSNCEAVG